jgi:hypothetical protein
MGLPCRVCSNVRNPPLLIFELTVDYCLLSTLKFIVRCRFTSNPAGEENLDLVESIRKSNIKLIVVRHEQAAGFMAATIGRLTGESTP